MPIVRDTLKLEHLVLNVKLSVWAEKRGNEKRLLKSSNLSHGKNMIIAEKLQCQLAWSLVIKPAISNTISLDKHR